MHPSHTTSSANTGPRPLVGFVHAVRAFALYWNPFTTLKHLMLEDSQGLNIFDALAQAQQRHVHSFKQSFADVEARALLDKDDAHP